MTETGWHTMDEEPPKDGRLIWLYAPGSMRLGFWLVGKQYENHGSIGGGWRDHAMAERGGISDLKFAPTHWLETPKPPEGNSH